MKIKSFIGLENIYPLFFIILIFSFDRFSKIKILSNFSERIYYINDFINLDLIWNTGIGFGLLSSDSIIFYNLISILICCVMIILFYLTFKADKYEKIILSIIIGGALGNFYDRIQYKAVPDFIDLHYGSFHWFTFNIADIFITFGIIIYIMKDILKKN